jgi:hypothetical protein
LLSQQVSLAQGGTTPPDTLRPANRSVPPASTAGDTIATPADTTIAGDSLSAKVPEGDIRTQVKYSAKDSIRFDVVNQLVHLYGDAKINYGDLSLTAEYITINWNDNSVIAKGGIDDSTGRKIGTPNFKQGSENYVADNIKYNFKTRKGIIAGVVTQQGEGYLHGETVKKNEYDELFVKHARYTTCNLEHPHFFIQADEIKVLPGDKLISGPFNLYVGDVPTPLGFAFGLFPTPRTSSSGIIMPSYGEAQDRGFFLRNGGFHWAVNDYVGVSFTGDVYSRGGYGLSSRANYRKRYAYDGGLQLRYNKLQIANEFGPSPSTEEFWVDWNHTPQTRKSSRFSTSVSAGTSRFNQLVSYDPQRYLSNTFRSNISYSKTFTGTPFSLNANLRQDQNTQTGVMNFTLPDVNLAMSRIYPLKSLGKGTNTWYQKISLSYNFNAVNKISNDRVINSYSFPVVQNGPARTDSVIPFNRQNLPEILDRAQIGGRHSIPISTSLRILKHFNLSPSFNYDEFWYMRRNNYAYNADSGKVEVQTVEGFSRAYSYGASAGLNTRLYGFFYFKRIKGLEAIRHVMTPTVSFSYRPDFSDPKFGMYQDVQIDRTGRTARLSPFQNALFGAPGQGRSGSINFSVDNNLEMKVRAKGDTASKFKKISLLDNFGLATNYNLMADSFNLSNITMNARTKVLNNLDININAVLDPYAYNVADISTEGEVRSRRMKQYAWQQGQGIGHLTQATLSLTTNLNPSASKKDKTPRPLGTVTQEQLDYINANPEMYVDFNIPWSLFVSYNLTYAKSGFEKSRVIQTLDFTGDISITDKWKIGIRAPFDFEEKKFGFTNINIYRDLHCWEMRFNWIPFGPRQSYTFDLNVKSSILRDLKLSRRRSWMDRAPAGGF